VILGSSVGSPRFFSPGAELEKRFGVNRRPCLRLFQDGARLIE
jgi:hypothetical protein